MTAKKGQARIIERAEVIQLKKQGWIFLTNEDLSLDMISITEPDGMITRLSQARAVNKTAEQVREAYLRRGFFEVKVLDEARDIHGNVIPNYVAVYVRGPRTELKK